MENHMVATSLALLSGSRASTRSGSIRFSSQDSCSHSSACDLLFPAMTAKTTRYSTVRDATYTFEDPRSNRPPPLLCSGMRLQFGELRDRRRRKQACRRHDVREIKHSRESRMQKELRGEGDNKAD